MEFDPDQTDAAEIVQSIEQAGFTAEEAGAYLRVVPKAATNLQLPRTTLVGGLLLIAAALACWIAGSLTWPVAVLAIAAAVVSGVHVALAAWRAIRLRAWI